MNYKICVVSGTRAEYGLLRNLIRRISKKNEFKLQLVITGSHLSAEHGMTIDEVKTDGFPIDKCINILTGDDTNTGMAKAVSLGIEKFANYFLNANPDIIIVLGDRYEIFAVVSAAAIMKIPVAHIHGGETSQGAIDEYFRHAITKMSVLHFVAAKEYAQRVIRMGEQPNTVHNVGSLGVENISAMPLLSRNELQDKIKFPLEKPYALVTYHPETLSDRLVEKDISSLIKALEIWIHKDNNVIITKANADAGGQIINAAIDDFSKENTAVFACESLGTTQYLSAMKHCRMVIGNSSSGIVEAPSFHIPTINIGDRQKGRLMADSIINCEPEFDSIIKAIRRADADDFRSKLTKTVNPYGDGETSQKIVEIIKERFASESISIVKTFYDKE